MGYIICQATIHHLRGRLRALRAKYAGKRAKGMGTMDKILIFEAVVLISYTIADLVIFYHVGAEPTTLTACVFSVCGLENGVMGWIKTNKDNAGKEAPEPPEDRTEPPDAGTT